MKQEQQVEESAMRAEDFLHTVIETGSVYGLSKLKQSGWAYCPSNQEETVVLLFFSTKEGERVCQKNGWEKYHLIRLDLDVFTDGWLPNMIQDGLHCGLNWDASLQGLELNPENVLEELEG